MLNKTGKLVFGWLIGIIIVAIVGLLSYSFGEANGRNAEHASAYQSGFDDGTNYTSAPVETSKPERKLTSVEFPCNAKELKQSFGGQFVVNYCESLKKRVASTSDVNVKLAILTQAECVMWTRYDNAEQKIEPYEFVNDTDKIEASIDNVYTSIYGTLTTYDTFIPKNQAAKSAVLTFFGHPSVRPLAREVCANVMPPLPPT